MENVNAPPSKQKEWKRDRLRNDDRLQMLNLARKLRKYRGEGQAGHRANVPPAVHTPASATSVGRKPPSNRIVTKKPSSFYLLTL